VSTVFQQEASYHARHKKRVVPPEQGIGGQCHLIMVDAVTRKNIVDRADVGFVSSCARVGNLLTLIRCTQIRQTFGSERPASALMPNKAANHRMLSHKYRMMDLEDTQSGVVGQPPLQTCVLDRGSSSYSADTRMHRLLASGDTTTSLIDCQGRDARHD